MFEHDVSDQAKHLCCFSVLSAIERTSFEYDFFKLIAGSQMLKPFKLDDVMTLVDASTMIGPKTV